MRMKSAWGLLISIVVIMSTLSCVKSSIPGASGTGFVWVATEGDQQIRAFDLNISNGDIGQVGSAQATGVSPVAMALSPDGTALFLANSSDNSVTSYSVGSDGSLGTGSSTATTTACTLPPPPCTNAPPPPVCGNLPVALAVDPSGKFLFVASQGTFNLCDPAGNSVSGTVSTYSINGTSLTLSSSIETEALTDITGTGPSAIVVAPIGNFLYVANQFSSNVQSFAYDAAGALTLVATATTGSNPSALAFSRCAGVTQGNSSCPAADGNNLFVANSGSDNISIFAACIQTSTTCGTSGASPDGSLVEISGSPVPAGISPTALIVDPAFTFVYAVNSKGNSISQYRYSSVTGTLTPLTPAAISAGTNPPGGGITGDGAYFFVANNNSSSMSVYTVSVAGRLSPAGTPSVTLAGQPSAILVR